MDKTVLQPGVRKWLPQVRQALKAKPYPAKRPLQTYIRTGNLANRWAIVGGITIVNTADYAEPVVGDDQADAFVNRWWTARSVVEDESGESLGGILIKGFEDQWH